MRAVALLAALLVATAQAALPWVLTPNGIDAFPPLFPIPKGFTNGTTTVAVNTTLTFNLAPISSDVEDAVIAAAQRFMTQTFAHTPNASVPSGALATVSVTIMDPSLELQLYTAENYTLNVGSDGSAAIVAQTVYGVYHALQTLSQLIGFDFDQQQYVIRHTPWTIDDAPRFPHRGVMIDSSRHFEPIATIKKVIDTLEMAKFNTLHWHIVDAISFPFQSSTFPLLGAQTSYTPQQRFTPNDVRDVVQYARARGIRVLAELDTPGHSAAMCFAYPEMCPSPLCPSTNVNNWALDITKNRTYEIIEGLLTEFASLFPEKMTHLGGDEVDFYCWSVHQDIVNWLEGRNLTFNGGFEYYLKRVQDFMWSTFPDRLVMGWQEIWTHFGTALNKKTIIQQWLPDSISLPLNVTSHGYRLVWSDSSVWYLDHIDVLWQQMYTADPCNGLPAENCDLILGGETCMWGETVDTSDILQTIWPRAAAVAERLWSPRHYNDTTAALPRMLGFRCLLNSRGIPAAPVENQAARASPPGPGSCFWQ
jgi:hexosaminidase